MHAATLRHDPQARKPDSSRAPISANLFAREGVFDAHLRADTRPDRVRGRRSHIHPGEHARTRGLVRSDLDVYVVEVGIVEVAAMPAPPPGRQSGDLDRLAILDDGPECLHLDEPVAQVFHRALERRRIVVHADVGATELAHPSRVVPAAVAVLLLADEDDDVVARHGAHRLECVLAPFVDAPPLEHLRIEHGDPAGFEQRHHEPDGISEVIERIRIGNDPTEDEALIRRRNLGGEVGLARAKLVTDPAIVEAQLEKIWSCRSGVVLEVAPVGNACTPVLRTRDGRRARERPMDLVEKLRIATAALEVRTWPRWKRGSASHQPTLPQGLVPLLRVVASA